MKYLLPEWYYLAVAIPFGIGFLVLTPPNQVPDEHAHILRAYQISEGRIIAEKVGPLTGSELPLSVSMFMSRYDDLRFHPEKKTSREMILKTGSIRIEDTGRAFINFANTAIHPPLAYLPQALGIFLARQFTSSMLALLYAGRVFNFVVATALVFCAIRRAPICKWIFVVLALSPMHLFMASSLSSDALTNALSFLIVAQVLHVGFGSKGSLTSGVVLMALLGAALSQCKQAYFLLPACYLLIPPRRDGIPGRDWWGFAFVMAATLLSLVNWAFVVSDIYSPANLSTGIDARRQLQLMFTEPQHFLQALENFARHGPLHLRQYIGVLGWLDADLSDYVIYAELAVMFVIALSEAPPPLRIKTWQALVALGIAFLVGLTVLVIIYLTWERVGSGSVGIQGRYFIPIGPLVWLAFSRIGSSLPRRVSNIWPFLCTVAVLSIPCLLLDSLMRVYFRYYQ